MITLLYKFDNPVCHTIIIQCLLDFAKVYDSKYQDNLKISEFKPSSDNKQVTVKLHGDCLNLFIAHDLPRGYELVKPTLWQRVKAIFKRYL